MSSVCNYFASRQTSVKRTSSQNEFRSIGSVPHRKLKRLPLRRLDVERRQAAVSVSYICIWHEALLCQAIALAARTAHRCGHREDVCIEKSIKNHPTWLCSQYNKKPRGQNQSWNKDKTTESFVYSFEIQTNDKTTLPKFSLAVAKRQSDFVRQISQNERDPNRRLLPFCSTNGHFYFTTTAQESVQQQQSHKEKFQHANFLFLWK